MSGFLATRPMPQTEDGIVTSLSATEIDVRHFLEGLPKVLDSIGVNPNCQGTIELVMAEALNNVAEHAYAGTKPGPIIVELIARGSVFSAHIRDHGVAMPGLTLPAGKCPDANVPLEDLPEGGFGWFLIKSLTQNLTYRRVKSENCLDFMMALPMDA